MEYVFLKYPKSVVAFAEELKRVIDDYSARKINNDELKEIALWYAEKCSDKLFQGQDYNITVRRIVGKRRLAVLNMILDGYQLTIFRGVK